MVESLLHPPPVALPFANWSTVSNDAPLHVLADSVPPANDGQVVHGYATSGPAPQVRTVRDDVAVVPLTVDVAAASTHFLLVDTPTAGVVTVRLQHVPVSTVNVAGPVSRPTLMGSEHESPSTTHDPRHVWPAVQTTPQAPQFSVSDSRSTQSPLQAVSPSARHNVRIEAQTPELQKVLAPHAIPHEPQFE